MDLTDADKELKKKAKTEKTTKKKKCHFRHDFNNVTFPQSKHSFRATMSSVHDGVLLWLEDKTTKQQWQNTITDVAGCGPPGIPPEAIIVFMKRAFDIRVAASVNDESDKAAEETDHDGGENSLNNEEPRLDLTTGDKGEVAFTLKLNLHGVWNPQFDFSLLPVGLEKTDILESKVKDLEEENKQLRAENYALQHPAFLSLSSATSCANGQLVSWDAPEPAPREICHSHFTLSGDNKLITVGVDGVYQVQTRLAVACNNNGQQSLTIKVNDVIVAGCTQCDQNHGYQNSPQLFEILRMRAGDTLAVQCNANNSSFKVAVANRLTMLHLGN